MANIFVIGSGLSGAVIARRHAINGDNVTVIDERYHIGGNLYDYWDKGVLIQKYGPHVFHTDDKNIWDYISQFSNWTDFDHKVKAETKHGTITLPFNLNTIEQLGMTLEEWENDKIPCDNPTNLEEKALSTIGKTLYEKLVKGYTEKQWGIPCNKLHPSIIDRIPVRLNWNDHYFNDYDITVLPNRGYTQFIRNILRHINIKVYRGTKFVSKTSNDIIYYSGRIDELICKHLPYRSIYFEETNIDTGRAVTNYPDIEDRYTRLTVMNRMSNKLLIKPIVSYGEIYYNYNGNGYPLYSIPTDENIKIYNSMLKEVKKRYPNLIPIGRIGTYRNLDMDEAIKEALKIEI